MLSTIQSKRTLREISSIKGIHSGLLSLYVPSNKNNQDVLSYIESEITESENIKDKTNRDHVISNLNFALNWLKHNPIEENGVIIFSGFIPQKGGSFSYFSKVITPHNPLRSFKYYCGKEFLVTEWKKTIENKKLVGLVVIDTKECTIGTYGGNVSIIKHYTSGIAGKHGQGGQSQQRFSRIHQEQVKQFYRKMGEKTSRIFLKERVDGILIGFGTIGKVKYFKDELDYRLKKKVWNETSIAYTDYSGLREIVQKSQRILKEKDSFKDEREFKKFKNLLKKDSSLVNF